MTSGVPTHYRDLDILNPRLGTGRDRMISLTLEYSLRAVVAIAQQGGEPCTSQKIAEITDIPRPYLSKMMQALVRAGIVHSQRGLHGGFVLARPTDQISIWDIAEVVDPVRRILHCPLKLGSHGIALCPLHRRIDEALAATEAVFRNTTLAEMLVEAGGPQLLCHLDTPPAKSRPQRTNPRR